ncbi:MAG: hypothetical protein QXL09_02590 [Candidatus Aenigmatarchaeota archaeon]
MKKLEQILLENGIIYYPLLIDQDIAKEIREKKSACLKFGCLIRDNKIFIRGIDLETAINAFPISHKEEYNKLREQILAEINVDIENSDGVKEREILEMIIYEIMPHFIEKRKFGISSNPSKKEILRAIRQIAEIPNNFYKKAETINEYYYAKLLAKINEKIANTKVNKVEGIISIYNFNNYIKNRIKLNILNSEKEKLKKEKLKKEKEKLKKEEIADIATLLWLQSQSQFEFDDFGFLKYSDGGGYTVYIKIDEEYALRDFDGKIYLFPPCKVAVNVNASGFSKPFVLGKYSHPFIKYFDQLDQPICIGNAEIRGNTKAEKIKNALEIGKNVLLYGYINSSGNFRPHFYLNKFSSNLISEKDPRIKSGKVKITNDPFIK